MKTQRDLSFLYASAEDPQIKHDRKQTQDDIDAFVKKWKGSDAYLSDPTALKTALDEYAELSKKYPLGLKDAVYFQLLTCVKDDDKIRAKEKQASTLQTNIFQSLQFFELSLGTLSKEKQQEFLENESLSFYAYYLERIFENAKYKLSEGEEKVLSLMSNPAYQNWTSMRSLFLSRETAKLPGDEKEYSLSEITAKLSDTKKEVRDGAAVVFNKILEKHKDVAEQEFNSVLEYKYITDTLRGYETPDQTALVRDGFEKDALEALLETTQKRNHLAHRFYKIKAKLLGQERLEYHERTVPIQFSDEEKEYSFEEGVDVVKRAFSSLGEEYVHIVEKLLEEGMVDVYPKKGKRGGAFNQGLGSFGGNIVLLNWTNKLDDVITLAHEMGHAINIELVAQNHPGIYFGYGGLLLAEVASTFFEGFVVEELLRCADEKTKLALLMDNASKVVSTYFRQVTSHLFERDAHQAWRNEGHLSSERLGELFRKRMEAYMGPWVEQSPGSQNRWVYWPHLREFFYNYCYGGAFLMSEALRGKVKEDPAFMTQIHNHYLVTGDSNSPSGIFANLGIDITDTGFWEKGCLAFEKQLDELETLIG